MCEKCEVNEGRLEKVRIFLWESVIEPSCTYKERYPDGDYGDCSASLTPRCDMNLCPRLNTELW